MGYHIEYAGPANQRPDDASSLRVFLMSAAFFLTFCMCVNAFWPQGRDAFWHIFFPGGAEPAREAAEVFVDELQNGAPISDAIENFCHGILDDADIS